MDQSQDDKSVEDFINEGVTQQELFNRLVEKNAIKVHKVFAQTLDGRELLASWTKDLMMVPSVTPDSTQFEAGIIEGSKTFVRHIINQCQKLEEQLSGDKQS